MKVVVVELLQKSKLKGIVTNMRRVNEREIVPLLISYRHETPESKNVNSATSCGS